MKFSISGADGAAAAGQGIGNIFKAFVMAPHARAQAQMEAAKQQADIFYRNQLGQQAQANIERLNADGELKNQELELKQKALPTALLRHGVPMDLAPQVQGRLETGDWGPRYAPAADGVGPVLPAPVADDVLKNIAAHWAGLQEAYASGSKVDQMAQADETRQIMGIRDLALKNIGNLGLANTYNTLTKPGATYEPFRAVGDTGYSINQTTGQQVEASPVIAKLFRQVEGALANQRNAAAGASGASAALSNARRDRVISGLDKPVTIVNDETGQASVTAIPTRGDPRTIGVAPPKGTGVDATNAKTRNAIIAAIEREMPYADEATIAAEVEKRLARRGMSANKNSAPNPGQPKIQLPQGYTSDRALSEAKAAIAAGKDRNAVIQRLRDLGVEPKGL